MKADLHIHTKFSYDGVSSPAEIVRSAIEKGIDCICITDHHEIDGAIEAMKFGFDKNILVVPGIEILTDSGDILGINIKQIVPDGLSPKETILRIRKAGGIAVIPHPFDKPFMGFWGGEKAIKAASPDAIEVFNASTIFKSSNKKALRLVQDNNMCFTAGSDSHKKQFVGRGYMEFKEKISSEKDLIKAIMEKTGKPGGKHLSLFEILKNSSNSNVKNMLHYCVERKRSIKEKKKTGVFGCQ